jgi:hypothetical protein
VNLFVRLEEDQVLDAYLTDHDLAGVAVLRDELKGREPDE